MLKDILKKENIKLNVEVKSWQEALRAAGKIIFKTGKIEKNYIDNMIDAVNKFGPYIVLTPGIAFAHSKPGEFVNENCMSLIRLKKPINFGCENDPVFFVFAFAATGVGEHIEVFKELISFFSVRENIEFINRCDNIEEIYIRIVGK